MITHDNGATTEKPIEQATNGKAVSPVGSDNAAAAPEPAQRRYVHLEGRAIVRPAIDPDTREAVLEVTFVDGEFKKLSGTSPLFVYPGEEGLRLMCHHLHMIASFSEEGYIRNEATLKVVNPLLEGWADLEVSKGTHDMTSTGPPKT